MCAAFPRPFNVFLTPCAALGVVAAGAAPGCADSTKGVGPRRDSQASPGHCPPSSFLLHPSRPIRASCSEAWWQLLSMVLVARDAPAQGLGLVSRFESFQTNVCALGVAPLGARGGLCLKGSLCYSLVCVLAPGKGTAGQPTRNSSRTDRPVPLDPHPGTPPTSDLKHAGVSIRRPSPCRKRK